MCDEFVQQLAKEYGYLPDLSKYELAHLLKAIATDRVNPNHYPPAQWAASFFVFLRNTGKHPEMLESPRQFAREIIGEFYSGGS